MPHGLLLWFGLIFAVTIVGAVIVAEVAAMIDGVIIAAQLSL